ncbi:MAG: GerMN domain-containing protein, partial [Chloroflexi bacterium]|nr:GerMN domain-containing protein [Chloroflexota bacterium]
VERNIAPASAPLQAVIRDLLSLHDQFYGQSGLYNSLYRSTLQLDSATIANGRATINLSGTIRVNGVCDSPRVVAQIQETALQFSTVKQVSIFVNGQDINTVLSQK